jgi:hypothetical protein
LLPEHIELDRDRDLLRQCGIDPNVLAFILAVEGHVGMPTEPRPQSAVGDDEVVGVQAPADGAHPAGQAQHWPGERGNRRTAVTATRPIGWFRRRFPATTGRRTA